MTLRRNSKAQVSIFLIVGLVIVIGGGMFLYFTRPIEKLEGEISIVEEQIPIQFDPIRSFVNNCLSSVSTDAINIIGKQGGYISFTDTSLNKETFIIRNEPTESDAVSFTKNSDMKIPYWHYLKSSNACESNCEFASKRPQLSEDDNSIERQIERYVNANFKSCTNNYELLKTQGYEITENSNLKSDVTITSQDIVVSAKYELEAKTGDSKSDMSQFLIRVPVNIAKVYDLATKITNMQIEHHFLEKHVLNLIVAFSGIDKEKLPPMSEMQFKFGSSNSWQKTEVKNKVTGMLTSYVPMFQVDGSYNYERNLFGSELRQRLYDSAIIPIANNSYSDLSAQFTYLDFWPAYFNLNCKGERCTPSSANSFFSFFGIQDYKFNYDISFPVLVEIKDEDAYAGTGYTFNFFLEGNIRNNAPMDSKFRQLDAISYAGRSQLCDIRPSGDITVNVIDSVTKLPVEEAQVLYSLIDEACFIGTTQNGKVADKFPVALGGVINIIKDGYIGKSIEFDAQTNMPDQINAQISPIKTKKIIVKKKSMIKSINGWEFSDIERDLSEKETATISLTRINAPGEIEFQSASEYKTANAAEIELAPGEYHAEITLIANERIVIPASKKCVTVILVQKCEDIPEIDLANGMPADQAQFISGGLNLNISVSTSDLDKETIILYVVSIDLADVPLQSRVPADLDQIGKIQEYSDRYKTALWPRFE